MDIWDTDEIKKAILQSEKNLRDEKARREWIADNIEVYAQEHLPKWKYDSMEIRADLILTREKLANLYLVTGNEDVLQIMGDLFRAIEQIKRL